MKQSSLEGLYEELNGLKSMADKEECINSTIRDAIRAKILHLPLKFVIL